jgi:CheY-like chemotaxis protein
VNARDAMPDGGTILISAREQTIAAGHETRLPPGQYVCLSVQDTGDGMSEETLGRAMEPFFTTKGVGKGTGLGLSSVMGMSQQVGGCFTLKSRVGEGTTAEIWLPSASSSTHPPEAKAAAAKDDAPRRALRVLAVDDDALVLFNTAAMLEDMGHTVLEATSGASAIEILRQQPIDLLITDQAMPKMTGVQLIESVLAAWPEIPVLLATGYAELPTGAARAVMKLNKPFTQEQLTEALNSMGF